MHAHHPSCDLTSPVVRFHPRSRSFLRALLAGVAVAALQAADPDLPFTSGSTGADGPLAFREIVVGGRQQHAMAYDPVRQEVVLFGGNLGFGSAETWVWQGGNWVRRLPPTSPPDRWGHCMVWDAARGEIVMFGGTRSTGRLNDTWTWNGTTWTEKNPADRPSPRDNFAMTYDAARNQAVLFGGNNGGDQTWLWDGSNWTLANPATKAPATGGNGMAYDAVRQEVVMFGPHGQTWIWNGATWAQRPSFEVPSARSNPSLIQDGTSNTILLFSGSNLAETWSWNGVNWTRRNPATTPSGRQFHDMAWDAVRQRVVLFGGSISGVDANSGDTWLWNGTDWTLWSNKTQFFDLAGRANGIFNFTTINVPPGITVQFRRNSGNTPVRWLATGDVAINGVIDAGGQFGDNALPVGTVAAGGPGGYDGGRGALRQDASGSFVGAPGQGPGGGAPGTDPAVTSPENLRDGRDGQHAGTYGNAFLQPLAGGSGGGGGASTPTVNGGNGGGGGGALMIASSRDILLNGVIRANGGSRQWTGASMGGRGSGGAILLRADRITGPGSLEAYGGEANNPNGRIRIEAYVRTLNGGQTPPAVVGLPAANGELNQIGTLTIISVDGANVLQPPTGNPLTPDVVFSDAGPVNVVVNGVGIPNGTPVTLRVTTGTGVITAGPVNFQNGTATFNVTVPAGVGTLQAIAQFTL
ncbi:MAG: hypothetical protein H7A46_18530 [Verrucomicrobiales bacterium]|nr:hypothetical protein [Verrucomicrobiales bacterium]